MYLDKLTSLEDHIISFLKSGPKQTLFLVEKIKSSHKTKKPTKQGIYKALRKLRNAQVVTIADSSVTLHAHFLETLSDFVRTAKQSAQKSLIDDTFLELAEGEKISYHFSTVEKADIFWAHVFSLLIETLDKKTPLYTYEPHNWFILSSRKSSELRLIRKMNEKNIPFLITVGHKSPLDMIAKKEYAITKNIQYYNEQKPTLGGTNYHLNIFGDIIIEVWSDRKSSGEIHRFFESNKQLTEENTKVLESFIHQKGKTRIIISRDAKRATRLKKKLDKYFY